MKSPPLASFEPLIRASTLEETGEYQLQVGMLYLRSPEYQKKDAEKEMPRIVSAVNHTYGSGINPQGIPAALEALQEMSGRYYTEQDAARCRGLADKALAALEMKEDSV